MSTENVQIIQRLYDAFRLGDVPAVLSQMDECIEWREADNFIYADRNPYIGPQAVLEGVFMRLDAEWEGFSVKPEQWLDADSKVVVLGTESGRYRKTGKEVHAQFAHIWRLRDDRVIRFQEYTDTKQFADAVR